MPCTSKFVDDKKYITYIHHDIPADGTIIEEIAHRPFPNTVKVDSDQVATRIDRRTAAISAGGMIAGNKTNRDFSIFRIRA